MDNSVMGGGLLQGSNAGIIDLEPSINRLHSSQPSMILHPNSQHQPHHLHTAMALSNDHPMSLFDLSPAKAAHNRGKLASSSASDDDDDHEPSFTNDDNGGPRATKGGSSSPWQRMKWTDGMVRLLITVVACVGDDGTPESCDGPVGAKRKAGGGGALQKKGKWKTVSKLMLEKGCYVSPQQCEDKFNDLNKRYKRLNEILGRGTTCLVVETPSLLDSMTHVTPKAKDDVRKILSSKHLFYREMCAYHNGQRIPDSHDIELPSCIALAAVTLKEGDGCGDEEEDEDDDDDEENAAGEGGNIDLGKINHGSFRAEMDGVIQDTTKTVLEQREWLRKRALQLQEERVEIQAEAFELEKRRLKWHRFCSKKDRELEMVRLENERMGLENERMTMQVKQKEMELEAKSSMELRGSTGFRMDREE